MEFKNTLKDVMEALVSGFDKKTIEENQEIYIKLKAMYEKEPNYFIDVIESAYHDFNTLIENVIDIPPSDEQYILEHIITGLYKHFHTQRIEKLEGSVCCYDKSSYIEKMTLKALRTQQNISLFADYKDIERIKENKERQAYWSPTTVKDTDEAINLFWKWYQISE
ncbi:hypothetical protein [Cytobacillus sp.]|uniref:hypothetical protein n=1 Tax=Cytobacillus sp. TaxID=2675269 RepID=UPI0028BF4C66|nr:hypothetical protein [Cytobacillus sp.]